MNPRRLMPVLLTALLLAGTAAATLAAARHERGQARAVARAEADRAATLIGFGMTTATESLDGVAGLFDASVRVSADDFARMSRRVLGYSGLGALAWAPRVDEGAGARFPIAYFASVASAPSAIGFDQGDEPTRRAALEAAVAAGTAVMTPPVVLRASRAPGILVYQPVFRGGGTPALATQRRARLAGFVVGAFRLDALQRRADAVVALGLPHEVRDGDLVVSASPGAALSGGARVPIPVNGRTWTVAVGAPPASRGLPLVTLLAGLGLTVLALAMAVALSRRDRFAREAVARATEDLRVSRRSQTALLENSPDIVARYDAGLRCLYANAAIERATGHPPSAFVGRNLDEVGLPDEMVTILAEAIATVTETGEERDVEYDVIGPQGLRAMHARLAPEFSEDGTAESVLVLSREVTAQRSAEVARRASEERYRTLVSTMSDGVVLHAATGVIVACNPAAQRILGLSADQLTGRAPVDPRWRTVHDDGSPFPAEEHPAMVTLRTGQPQRDVIMGVHTPNGSLTWISVTTEPVDGGGDVSVVCCFSDVTTRLNYEREEAALRRIATMVAAHQDAPAQVFAHVAQEAAGLVGAETAAVVRFEAARRAGAVMGVHPPAEGEPSGGQPTPLDPDTATGAVAETGGAARRAEGPGEPGHPSAAGPVSAVAAPIVVEGQVWGVLSAASSRPEPLPAGAEELLARLAELAALAILSASAREQLATLAATDHLTGLWNRRVFQERITAEVERACRHGRPMSLVTLDIDHFKRINDAHGHPTGDRVLIEVARRLFATVREGETVARVGGEEFAWILPETDGAGALGAAERARRAIQDRPFADVGTVTVSLGVCDLDEAGSAADLVRLADRALYTAKATGRNRVARHAPSVTSGVP